MKVPVRFTRLLAVILVAACSRFSAPAESAIPKIAVEKTQLANGLDVLMVEDHRLPRVSVSIWYHVGPVNEEPGRTGFAHLFEHMMFQKSKHVAEDAFFRTLEAAGGSDINGTTDQDRTNYFETVPTNQLETVLWLESDRMGYLLDDLTAESFKNQQDVVRNERRQSIENEPYGIVSEAVTHALFPKEHPYYADVIGSHQDIQSAQVADVRKFFKQYYSPNNASIAIVGDIDKTKTRQLVEKYFGSLKRGPDVPAVHVTTPEITSERRVVVKDHVELPRLYMAWITPPIFKPGDAEADLAAGILGQGKSSRLYRTSGVRQTDRTGCRRIFRAVYARIKADDLGNRSRRTHAGGNRKGNRYATGITSNERTDRRGIESRKDIDGNRNSVFTRAQRRIRWHRRSNQHVQPPFEESGLPYPGHPEIPHAYPYRTYRNLPRSIS